MSVETLPALVDERARPAGLDHYVCDCDPDTALCGTDVSTQNWLPPEPGPHDCVVCVDLVDGPCPLCGAVP